MPARPLFVMHIALQGCMRARDPEYGLTADTGGHIRYVLDQVRALAARPEVERVEVVTRGFVAPSLGPDYAVREERIDDRCRLVRLFTREPGYLRKEALEPEHDSFLAALLAHLDTLPRMPDLLHAHYADAGLIAARLRELLGIPFLFTAHSLGRVKREHQRLPPAELATLERRIGFEEAAIADAAAIFASSRDERDEQLTLYRSLRRDRVHVLPPGCDDRGFAAAFCPGPIAAELGRFLREPGRPVVLAIARPVRRKNLEGLVDAFGRSAALREAANLVIVAGTRDDVAEAGGEAAGVLRDLLLAIDRHDLYGRVAYPKQHAPADIPGYYAFARERGGVFVNPAFNEPYGLTLLEAASSGLPVVATASGGPADIVADYGNGLLVDPHDPAAIAGAVLDLLGNRLAWRRFAEAGRSAARMQGWDRHAERYVALANAVLGTGAGAPADEAAVAPSMLLVSETVERPVPTIMGRWLRARGGVMDAVTTSGGLDALPADCGAAIAICRGGAEIHRRGTAGRFEPDGDWERAVSVGWNGEAVERVLLRALALRPVERGRLFRRYACDGLEAAQRLQAALFRGGLRCGMAPCGDGTVLVLPPEAGIRSAVDHLRRSLGLDEQQVIGTPLLDPFGADTVHTLPAARVGTLSDRTLVVPSGGRTGRRGPVATS